MSDIVTTQVTIEQFLGIVEGMRIARVEYSAIDIEGAYTWRNITGDDIDLPEIIESMVRGRLHGGECDDGDFVVYIDIFAEVKDVPVWMMQVCPADCGFLEVSV